MAYHSSVRLIGDYSHRNESCCGAVYLSTLETTDPTPGVPGRARAWAAALTTLHQAVVTPIYGVEKKALTARE